MQPFRFEVDDVSEQDWQIIRELRAFLDEIKQPITNADRIRAMSDEELANVVVCPHCKTNWDKCTDDCFTCRLEWLKQPAGVDDASK